MTINIPFFLGQKALLNELQITRFPTYALIGPGGKVEIIEGGIEEVQRVLQGIFEK